MWLLVALAVLAASPVVRAADLPDLYQAEVPVSGQGPEERQRALAKALEQVVVRLTGQRSAAGLAGLGEARRDPARYVRQYRYRAAAPAGGGGEAGLVLWAELDGPAVNTLLRDAGVPVWGKARPGLVLWLAVDDGSGMQIEGGDLAQQLSDTALAVAGRRGIPLLAPLLDLEDRSRITPRELSGPDVAALREASRRYGEDGFLGVLARPTPAGAWEAQFVLYRSPLQERWSTRADRADLCLTEGVERAADLMAAKFAPAGTSATGATAEVRVSGIDTVEDYARVIQYLGALELVKRLRVVRLEAGTVTLRLDTDREPSALTETILLGQTLAPAAAEQDLDFRLVR
jgi:hypothetical protein